MWPVEFDAYSDGAGGWYEVVPGLLRKYIVVRRTGNSFAERTATGTYVATYDTEFEANSAAVQLARWAARDK